MFFRAIKAVISRQPEALYFSDFFILRYLTSVLIFVKLYSRMTVLSCQRSFTSKVLSPYCLRRLHFVEMRRSSCSWWGVSSFPHLLSAIIADQLLPDFSEVGKRESPTITRPISKKSYRSLGVPFSLATAKSYQILPESSLSAGVIRFSMSLHRQRDQIITSVGGRKSIFRSFTL